MRKVWTQTGLTWRFRISLLDGETVEVETIIGDAMQWERVNKRPIQEALGPSVMLWCAWRALRRLKATDEASFDTWADGVRDFEFETEDDEADADDPTQPAL